MSVKEGGHILVHIAILIAGLVGPGFVIQNQDWDYTEMSLNCGMRLRLDIIQFIALQHTYMYPNTYIALHKALHVAPRQNR